MYRYLKIVLRWIPAIFIMSVSWYLSSQTRIEQMPSFINADKLIHLICFAGLAFWVSFGLGMKGYKRVWLGVLIVSVYGAIDEWHQSFVPGRSASVFDWLFDTVGALLGCVVYVWLCKKLFKTYWMVIISGFKVIAFGIFEAGFGLFSFVFFENGPLLSAKEWIEI